MKNERINELIAEFRSKAQEYYICLHFAASGIEDAAEIFAKDKPKQDAKLWISDIEMGNQGEATINKNYASISIDKYLTFSRVNGEFSNEIAKAFVCTIYSLWDETYRNLIAKAAHVEQKSVFADLMGDIRHVRNCIIHAKSILAEEPKKIKVLCWNLQPGELVITKKMFAELVDQINQMPVTINKFKSSNPEVQRFYDELDDHERRSFDSWISTQNQGADIRKWPQWNSVTARMEWLGKPQ